MGKYVGCIKKDARGIGLCIDPVFSETTVTVRPIPRALLDKVKEGEIWEGRLGLVYFHGKRDKNGKKILVQFFIPEKRTNMYHAVKNLS